MSGIGFTEELAGWLSFEETDFNQALLAGRRARRTALVHLKIEIPDVDRFVASPEHRASATGWLDCGELGGRLAADEGSFELFVETPDAVHLRMRYRLFLRDGTGDRFTLVGFKLVENDLRTDHWADVTTLFVRLHAGRVEAGSPGGDPLATGVLRVGLLAFLRQLTTYRGTASTRLGRLADIGRFQAFFMAKLALAYAGAPVHGRPSFPEDRPPERPAATGWEPFAPRPELARRLVPYTTEDGLTLLLENVRPAGRTGETPAAGPVLLAHGAGLRAQTFYGQPGGRTLVDELLEAGYDVWSENWRGSSDLPTYSWTLDEVARYDHPAAVREILAQTGATTLKAVVHCQGSVSFTMAAVAGLVPEVTHVVATGVSLHVRVPVEAREKQGAMLGLATRLTPWIDAQWAIRPVTGVGRGLARLGAMSRCQQGVVRELMHLLAAYEARRGNRLPPPGAGEEEVPPHPRHPGFRGAGVPEHPVCTLANFMYGGGADVLWRAGDVPRDVDDWMGRELGASPLSLFNQIRASTDRGHVAPAVVLPMPDADADADGQTRYMPSNYVAGRPRTDARFTFVVGTRNRMFLPSGMRATFEHFARHAPAGHHAFAPVEGFGHLDVYFGRRAATVVFPIVLEGLARGGTPAGGDCAEAVGPAVETVGPVVDLGEDEDDDTED